MRVWLELPDKGVYDPTAQTSLAVTAATPSSWLMADPWLGLATTRQLAPSQCSMRVWPGLLSPTAQTSLAVTAATSLSWLMVDPWLGLATTLQLAPSQCSTRVWLGPVDVGVEYPTAQ